MNKNRKSLISGLVFFVVCFAIRTVMGDLAEHGAIRLAVELALATVVFVLLMRLFERIMARR